MIKLRKINKKMQTVHNCFRLSLHLFVVMLNTCKKFVKYMKETQKVSLLNELSTHVPNFCCDIRFMKADLNEILSFLIHNISSKITASEIF